MPLFVLVLVLSPPQRTVLVLETIPSVCSILRTASINDRHRRSLSSHRVRVRPDPKRGTNLTPTVGLARPTRNCRLHFVRASFRTRTRNDPIGLQYPANRLDQRSASLQFEQPSSTSTVSLSTASLSTSTRRSTNNAVDRSARSSVFDLCKVPSSNSVNVCRYPTPLTPNSAPNLEPNSCHVSKSEP